MIIPGSIYMSQLKWKLGERRAIGTARGISGKRLVPLFKFGPGAAYDNDRKCSIAAIDHLQMFGVQLQQCWGSNLAFLDASLLDGDDLTHPLAILLDKAAQAGAVAAPVTSMSMPSAYQSAVKLSVARSQGVSLCLRVGLRDLESDQAVERIKEFLAFVGAKPETSVLLVDGGALYLDGSDRFANALIEALAHIPFPQRWNRVFWSCTSFPEKVELQPGQIGMFRRLDWELYQTLMSRSAELPLVPMFSDYGLEYPTQYKATKAPPSAHLRYSTERDYVVAKGTSTKKPNGYEAIFPVASSLVRSSCFKGPSFSDGDAFIHRLGTTQDRTGHASDWRWAAADHHLTLVLSQLREMYNLPEDVEPVLETAQGQGLLV